uniref:Capsule gland specific secretory protein n=1 Tax=Reishia bronni TaxID=578817 RepID=A0A6G9KRX5_9CAEN|nr:capsule gland specific secretory protein [Reishia bronni]
MPCMLLPLCWMAVTMTATATNILPPDRPDHPVTTCAATSCLKLFVCRIVIQNGKIGPRCLNPRHIPPGGGPKACGPSGHPLLRGTRKDKKTVYTVFKCKETCPAPTLVCVNRVCCAEVDTCDLPKVVGPCKARIPRYYYDSNKKKCLLFFYGGCEGNDNNFKTPKDCQKTCPRGPAILPQPACALIDCKDGFKCIEGKSGPRCVPVGNGKPAVSGRVCPPVQPHPKGSCGKRCKADRECRKGEKCCRTGCGHKACRRTVPSPTCLLLLCPKGTVCKETPKGPQCVKRHPVGVCPPVPPRRKVTKGLKGACGKGCKEDRHCKKGEKCCQTSCGYRACRRTVILPTACAFTLCATGTVCIDTPQGAKCVPTGKP